MENIAKHSEITVYAVNWCPHCWGAKNFLDAHGIEHTWVDIERNPEGRASQPRYAQRPDHGLRRCFTLG